MADLAQESSMLFPMLLRVKFFVTQFKLLFDPRVILMERDLVPFGLLIKLSRGHFKHKIVVFLVVKNFECQDGKSKVFLFGVFPRVFVFLRSPGAFLLLFGLCDLLLSSHFF